MGSNGSSQEFSTTTIEADMQRALMAVEALIDGAKDSAEHEALLTLAQRSIDNALTTLVAYDPVEVCVEPSILDQLLEVAQREYREELYMSIR